MVAGNSYTFQADLVALFPEAPANLQFAIEFFNGAVSTGVTVLSPVVVPDFSVLGWGTTVVNMGAAPVGADKATITLNNAITAASGNDFGVDNIIITDTTAPPPPPPPTTNCVVVAGCEPTTTPAGKHIPTAGNNPKSGQNPDGFYQLMAASFCPDPGNLQVYVKDSASSFIAGPFLPGAKVKITQAPGVTANSKPMAGVIVAHIQLKGDALVCAYDPVNKVWSDPSSCLVPPKPK